MHLPGRLRKNGLRSGGERSCEVVGMVKLCLRVSPSPRLRVSACSPPEAGFGRTGRTVVPSQSLCGFYEVEGRTGGRNARAKAMFMRGFCRSRSLKQRAESRRCHIQVAMFHRITGEEQAVEDARFASAVRTEEERQGPNRDLLHFGKSLKISKL